MSSGPDALPKGNIGHRRFGRGNKMCADTMEIARGFDAIARNDFAGLIKSDRLTIKMR
jgi:hypothetical protein